MINQVRDYLHGIEVDVVKQLPWFHGVGLFQLRNPVVAAALVGQGPVNFVGQSILRFIRHDHGINFRAHQGARNGWIMFIGIPMDYRNTECITEAVNTFGEFHYWQHHDIQKCRTLVYATFPAPALVPRDVVFRQPRVARYAGVRHSWTAPCYILSMEAADTHPADEDPMPMNGNPHPMPGHLNPDLHMHVPPEYPAIGWNMPPPPNQGGPNQGNQLNQDQVPINIVPMPPHASDPMDAQSLNSAASVQGPVIDISDDAKSTDVAYRGVVTASSSSGKMSSGAIGD